MSAAASNKFMVEKLSTLLRDKEQILTTAESCTGGMIAAAITDLAGSSHIFDRGFVTYSNQAKQGMLGVSSDTLEKYGAVSKQCAKEMVLGALDNSNGTVAVSVTGIAGPGGATEDKPVGLVYIGICLKEHEPIVNDYNFEGNRESVRQQTLEQALVNLISLIG